MGTVPFFATALRQQELVSKGKSAMSDALGRRDFLKLSLAAAAAPLAGGDMKPTKAAKPAKPTAIKPEAGSDKLTVYKYSADIWLRWANQTLTCYRAHRSQKYPYFYPLAGPLTGLPLTSETSVPFPHHRSVYFACDKVNGGDYWQEELKDGQILSAGPQLGPHSPQSAVILDQCEWRKNDGPVQMTDRRKYTVTVVGPKLWFLDAEINWAAAVDVTIQHTNHSLFSTRVAPDITPWAGGTLVNSEGGVNEKGTFGKTAAWCAFFGKRRSLSDNPVEGLALLDHPKNPWAPSPWFTRDYGMMSPTPMNFLKKPWQLAAGKSIDLRYRVIAFAGDPQEAGIAALYKAWAAS
jgi:hypothetical protein